MKRILVIVFLLAALGITSVMATPVAELNDLARYFPADVPVFVAVRTDDAFFSELDGIIAKVAAALPSGAPAPDTIVEMLDKALADTEPPMSFQEDIRPWLGDTIAVGVLEIPERNGSSMEMLGRRAPIDDESPVLVAVSITDRAAVTDFFINGMTESGTEFERTDVADVTIITPIESEATETPDGGGSESSKKVVFVIRDDALFITNQPESATTLPDSNLADNADFNETFALLPGDDYNITLYMDFGVFIKENIANDPDAEQVMGLLGGMFNAFGPQVWGVTLLDGVSLTFDAAQRITDPAAFEEFGFPITSISPIDPDFAAHIPAGATLAMHSTDLNRSFNGGFDMLEKMIADMSEMDLGNQSELEEATEGIAQIESAFTAFTGLDLREDVLPWMTGDYALFIMPNPKLNVRSQFGIFQTLPVDFGMAIEVTDSAAADKTVEGLTEAVERIAAMVEEQENASAKIELTTETIAGTDVSVITITSKESPWPVELLIGANDEVFALGTRNAVQAILTRDGGLPSDAAYSNAQAYVLENTYALGYFGPQSLLPLADLITAFADEDDDEAEQNAEAARKLIGLVQSAISSQTIDADGNAVTRVVITLSE